MSAQYEIDKSSNSQFFFRLKADNGEIVLQSEQYSTKANAQVGIEAVRSSSNVEARFERKKSTADQPYFILKGANGETLGQSEMYSSPAAMEKGITAVKSVGPKAPVVDLT